MDNDDPIPTLREALDTTRRIVIAQAMERHGSITRAARALGCSRRTLRSHLQRLGLYPWPPKGLGG